MIRPMSDAEPRLGVALNGYGLENDEPDGVWREVLSWDDFAGLARLAEERAAQPRAPAASAEPPPIGGEDPQGS